MNTSNTDGDIALCCVCMSVCAYLLTAPQTATAPRDAPWLLPTETAQWPGAETQKHTQICSYVHTHAHIEKHLLKHNRSNPRGGRWLSSVLSTLPPVCPTIFWYSGNTSKTFLKCKTLKKQEIHILYQLLKYHLVCAEQQDVQKGKAQQMFMLRISFLDLVHMRSM